MRATWGPAVLAAAFAWAGCLGPAPAGDASTDGDAAPGGPVTFEALEVTTESGVLVALLYPEAAPHTVRLMRTYANESYFVGREFLRTIPGFVIQVADRFGGETEDTRRVPLEPSPRFAFAAGALGIARGADPYSGGPEIFIMDFPASHLNGNYTVWGQLVRGLDVVHVVARQPAVDQGAAPAQARDALGSVPVAGEWMYDRTAARPVRITGTALLTVTMPAEEAARYPLQTATSVRDERFRSQLEWPANVAVGAPSDFTWYLRPYGENVAPPAADVAVRIGPATLPVAGESTAGIYRFAWTPPSSGNHTAALLVDGEPLHELRIRVPDA